MLNLTESFKKVSNFPVSLSLYAACKLDEHEGLSDPSQSQTNQAVTELRLGFFNQKYY